MRIWCLRPVCNETWIKVWLSRRPSVRYDSLAIFAPGSLLVDNAIFRSRSFFIIQFSSSPAGAGGAFSKMARYRFCTDPCLNCCVNLAAALDVRANTITPEVNESRRLTTPTYTFPGLWNFRFKYALTSSHRLRSFRRLPIVAMSAGLSTTIK